MFNREKTSCKENINYTDIGVNIKIGEQILRLLPKDFNKQVVVLCIGTDRSTGDALGPLVGSFLLDKPINNFYIYGTLAQPVHALNLEQYITKINNKYDNPFIISVDACLGRLRNVGKLQVKKGALKPGAAVNKNLPAVGNMHITGIVNVSGFMELTVLQNTRLNIVMEMSKSIANGIYYANYFYNKNHHVNNFNKRLLN